MKQVIYLTFVLCLFSLKAYALEKLDCDQVWIDVGSIIKTDRPVRFPEQIPESKIVQGISFKLLQHKNGDLFRPSTLEQSVCALDSMLEKETREALYLGVLDYIKNVSPNDSPEERLDKLDCYTNNRLRPLVKNPDIENADYLNIIFIQMEEQFGINYWDDENKNEIQKLAAKEEIFWAGAVTINPAINNIAYAA
jgi:hypothetical protein